MFIYTKHIDFLARNQIFDIVFVEIKVIVLYENISLHCS